MILKSRKVIDFELKTERRRSAVKHMRIRINNLNRSLNVAQSLREQDAITQKIDFLTGVVERTMDNLDPRRKRNKTSLAESADAVSDEQAHIYENDKSSLHGFSNLYPNR